MKGVDVAIADPAPVDPNQDDRPSIPELILAHRHSVDEVKAELLQEPEFDYGNKHDDLDSPLCIEPQETKESSCGRQAHSSSSSLSKRA
jgi:hypothetical protein